MSDAQQLTKGIASHGMWKQRLIDTIKSGKSDWKPEIVCKDNQCEFGKWLYSCSAQDKASAHYRNVRALHTDFHKNAANVLELALKNKQAEAESAIQHGSKYASTSSDLTKAMMNWKKELS
ncbi:MAG: CZB domain-containing protein [Thiotrichales bacterium]|nr:CZB domain-containing protein [Thiotrichales bacterium]